MNANPRTRLSSSASRRLAVARELRSVLVDLGALVRGRLADAVKVRVQLRAEPAGVVFQRADLLDELDRLRRQLQRAAAHCQPPARACSGNSAGRYVLPQPGQRHSVHQRRPSLTRRSLIRPPHSGHLAAAPGVAASSRARLLKRGAGIGDGRLDARHARRRPRPGPGARTRDVLDDDGTHHSPGADPTQGQDPR